MPLSKEIQIVVIMLLFIITDLPLAQPEGGIRNPYLCIELPLSQSDASFWGEKNDDQSGRSVTIAGDVNGDGYDDLLIGADNNDDGGGNAGETYLFFGKPWGWVRDLRLSRADASFIGEQAGDNSGTSVAGAGDVNGDGYDDFLIGAPLNQEKGTDAGETYLILGKSAGWPMHMKLSNSDASFRGEHYGDLSGTSVAGAGDVNGDGYDDFIIGAPYNDNKTDNAGQTYLILGKPNGWGRDINLSNTDASFLGEYSGDYSGSCVSGAGDVNRDGYDDFLIGADFNDEGGPQAGQTYLVMGKNSGWNMHQNMSNASASFWGEHSTDGSGCSVAGAGDVNGDGYDDILIGDSNSSEGSPQVGESYIIFGKPYGWTMDKNLSTADASFCGEQEGDRSGTKVAGGGDVNGDGYDDILIGAPTNGQAKTSAGKTYLILGKRSGWMIDVNLSNADAAFLGVARWDNSGVSAANSGDVNGDGCDDILIGADANSEGGSGTGQSYLILSSSIVPPPRDLKASLSKEGDRIILTWGPAGYWKEPITGYRVCRSMDKISYEMVAAVPRNRTCYVDKNVEMGRTYYYRVETLDKFGQISGGGHGVAVTCDRDTDLDGIGDSMDDDDDGDGIPDLFDANPQVQDCSLWGKTDVDLSDYGTVIPEGSVVAGDMNGDGYDDLLVGEGYNDEVGYNAGKTYFIFGDAAGLTNDISVADADASFLGEATDDNAGLAVAGVGDVNRDGYDDILIGAHRSDDGGVDAGQTYLILGKASGWALNISLSEADASFLGEGMSDLSGNAIAGAGDVNGDGYDDMLIGAFWNDEAGNNAGQTYLIFGKASGWAMDTDLSTVDASFLGEHVNDFSGDAIAGVRDVNGDGYDDFLIPARENGDGGTEAGQTYLILGRTTGWAMDTSLSKANASFWGEDAADYSGNAIASAGDVNGDGYFDFLIGAYGDDDGGDRAGQIYLILGKASGWAMDTDLSKANASFWGEEATDGVGFSTPGAGDVNGDGFDDILIGVPWNSEADSRAGQTYIIFGRASGWAMDIDLSKADASFLGERAMDWSGALVASAGDTNRDGSDEFIIGGGPYYLIQHNEAPPVQNLGLNLTRTQVGINLYWADDYKEPWFFGIYRGVRPDQLYRLVRTSAANFTDWNVRPGVTYYYSVSVVDPLGGESSLASPLKIVADADKDGDGQGNMGDTDDDGDGYPDGEEMFPLNASEWLDSDLDGIGNNADTDDDNDGIPDNQDAEPLNPVNGLTTYTGFINSTLQDIRNRLDSTWISLGLLNTNLSTFSDAFNSLSPPLSVIIGDLRSEIAGVNSTLAGDITTLNSSMRLWISELSSSARPAISETGSSLSEDLASFGPLIQEISLNISAIDAHFAVVNWSLEKDLMDCELSLKADAMSLEILLSAMNASLHAEREAMNREIYDFRNEMIAELDFVLTHAGGVDVNLTAGLMELEKMKNDMNNTSLAQIKLQLMTLESNTTFAGFNLSLRVETFRKEAMSRLMDLNILIATANQMISIVNQINETKKDLTEAKGKQASTSEWLTSLTKADWASSALLVTILALEVIMISTRKKGRS